MTVQHNAITDPDIHEPKGIAAATAGKVYVSDGASSGDWKYAPGKAHAEIVITAGTTALTLNAAADTYIKLNPTGEWAASSYEEHLTVDPTNGEVDLLLAGHYYIDFWCNFTTESVASNKLYKFKFALDGTTSNRTASIQKHTSGVDTLHVAASGLITATANQALSIYVAGDATTAGTDITVLEAGLTVMFLD